VIQTANPRLIWLRRWLYVGEPKDHAKCKAGTGSLRSLGSRGKPNGMGSGSRVSRELTPGSERARGCDSPGYSSCRTIADLFPSEMSSSGIESAIRQAYRHGDVVGSQGDRLRIVGSGGGTQLEMWLNDGSRLIESAYPKY
jgi:hypothetical protein